MNKVWNKEDIKKVIREISEKMGIDATNIPIEISSRMKKCKGKFVFRNIRNPKGIYPLKFKFAEVLLYGNYAEDIVRESIVHEYIHFYTNSINKENCKHDYRFKANCRKAGISDSTYFTAGGVGYKYKIVCNECGGTCYRYRLKCDVKTYLEKFECKCGGSLKVIELDSENKAKSDRESQKKLIEFLPVNVKHTQISLFA